MRLKTLRIKGFKSFGEDTLLNFSNDVIGVVGPNGSGKSNIVDAIRWVLGEQKGKELRLEHKEDVLFNGTKKRKKAKLAQVTLTFENTKGILPIEYQTVAISRYLYQSGESEYRLNDVKCRLKDITNLFVDTGIGSNSYAIIALGMVDDILENKDNARRRMFEQAAGITKYKKRKKETINKLKLTTEDLNRIDDLLYEIENNLKTLEKQARRTKRFFELKEKYKEASTELAIIQSKDYKNAYDELKKSITEKEDALIDTEKKVHQLEASIQQSKKGVVDKERGVMEKNKRLHELIAELAQLESNKKIKHQRIDFIQETTQQLDLQIASAKETDLNLIKRLSAQQSLLLKAKSEEEKTALELAKITEEHQVLQQKYEAVKSSLDQHVIDKQNADKEIYEIDKTLAINSNKLQSNQHIIERNNTLIENQSEEKERILGELTHLKKKIEQQKKLVFSLELQETEREKRVERLQQKISELDVRYNQLTRTIDAKQNEYNLLKSMVDKLEGFPESIKFLNKNWDDKVPVLSDIIDCPNYYKRAIEQYLEPYLNYYIVDTIQQAKSAIELLSQAQKGKANFFLLNAIPVHKQEPRVDSSLLSALDLLEVDMKYLPLMRILLNNVYLTDLDIDAMDAISQGEDIILISKQTGIIKRKISLTGGSWGLFEGKKLGRKKQLQKLEQILSKYKKQENELSGELLEAKEALADLRVTKEKDKIKQYQIELSQSEQSKIQLSTNIQNMESYNRQYIDRNAELLSDNLQIEQSNATLTMDLIGLKEVVKRSEVVLEQKGGNVQTWMEELARTTKTYNDINIRYIQRQNATKNIQQEIHYIEKQQSDLQLVLKQEGVKLEENSREFESLILEIRKIEEDLKERYQHKSEIENDLHQTESEYDDIRNAVSLIEQEVIKNRALLSQQQHDLAQLKDQFSEVRIQLTGIGERLYVEFKISLEKLMTSELQTERSLDELDEIVEKLRTRLNNYGEINPMALEAYEEMKSRYEDIIEQKKDIEDAKSSLLMTIEEIETTATEHFLTAFNEVKIHFKEVFRNLFTVDDDCDLVLLNEQSPLDSEIEIIAKPKGKRPKTLSQLSGGEKTLTAIALLFSLYLQKPAPFCIFDEVDAPLDDANILKFNKIIKEFSNRSQFIIVTHNKLTMAEVDVLYGIFMEEQGISSISEVDFGNLLHDPVVASVNN